MKNSYKISTLLLLVMLSTLAVTSCEQERNHHQSQNEWVSELGVFRQSAADTTLARQVLKKARSWWIRADFDWNEDAIVQTAKTFEKYAPEDISDLFAARIYLAQTQIRNWRNVPDSLELTIAFLKDTQQLSSAHGCAPVFECTLANFLLAYCYEEVGQSKLAVKHFQVVLEQAKVLKKYPLLRAETQEWLGVALMSLEEYAEGQLFIDLAFATKDSLLTKDHPLLALGMLNYGAGLSYQNKLAEAITYTKAGTEILKKNTGDYGSDLIAGLANLAWLSFFSNDYTSAFDFFQEANALLDQFPTNTLLAIRADLLYFKGHVYQEMGAYQKSRDCFMAATEAAKIGLAKDSSELAYFYNATGVALRVLKEEELAEEYFSTAMKLRIPLLGPESLGAAASYYTLGRLYREMERYPEALDYLNRALRIRAQSTEEEAKEGLSNCYSTLAITYLAMGKYDLAETHLKKMLALQEANKDNRKYLAYDQLGQLYFTKEQYQKSATYYKKAIGELLSIKKTGHPLISNAYTGLATAVAALGMTDQSLACIDSALAIIEYNPDQLLEQDISFSALAYTLNTKAALLKKKYEATNDPAIAKQIDQAYEELFRLFDFYQVYALDVRSKVDFINKRYHWLEAAIDYYYTENKPERCFSLMERVRSTRLRQAFFDANARLEAGIPEELSLEEQRIRNEIFVFQQQLKNRTIGDVEKENLSAQLSTQKEKLNDFVHQLSLDYPDYYDLRYQTKLAQMEEVQAHLQINKQTMLSYFVGDSALYCLVVLADDTKIVKIDLDFPLDQWVNDIRKGLTGDPRRSLSNEMDYLGLYRQAALELYQRLLLPVEKFIENEQRLLILSDGSLNALPFEVLLREMPEEPENLRRYPYVLNDHSISYSYSATLDVVLTKNNPAGQKNTLLVIAPDYHATSSAPAVKTLQGNIHHLSILNEDQDVLQKFTRVLDGELAFTANKSTLREQASKYKILHFSTHAIVNTKHSELTFLVLQNETNTALEPLYLGEVYNLSLPTELVVLSACETEIGIQQRGEGLLSLARSFKQAGANSVMGSHWKVNEQATHRLMHHFYSKISQGKTKDVSLREAKLEMLQKNYPHPYYWAGFVGIGNMDSIIN